MKSLFIMKRYSIWILLGLISIILSGLLGFPSISLAEKGKWTKKADMPTKRAWFSTSEVNGKIYAIGGRGGGSTVEEYDPATDTWTKKADMPAARDGLSTSDVNGKIYAIGGSGTGSAVEEYDPTTDTWTKKAEMPTKRWLLSSSAVKGKIYAIGGEATCCIGGPPFSTVEEYDPATDKWTKKADMPTKRSSLTTAAVVNEKIYAIGGLSVLNVLSTVEEYDPATDKWTKKAEMPTKRSDLSASAVSGKIYVIGGISGESLSTVEEYDPATGKWTKKADMPTPRGELSSSVVSGKIYAIGGSQIWWPPAPLSTVEEYDTGLAGESIESKGKFVTLWGEIKAKY